MDRYEAPNAGAFVNGPVVHHFEDFGLRAYRPEQAVACVCLCQFSSTIVGRGRTRPPIAQPGR